VLGAQARWRAKTLERLWIKWETRRRGCVKNLVNPDCKISWKRVCAKPFR
jgi:hypothetical protein